MLTYTYKCEQCNKTYDIAQPLSESHLTECPVCKSCDFRRTITAPMIKTKSKVFQRTPKGTVGEFGPEL